MLKNKILLVFIFIFLFSFLIFSQDTIIKDLSTQLEKSTEEIIKLKAENEQLKADIKNLQETFLIVENEKLKEENSKYVVLIAELTKQLKESTDLIVKLKERIQNDQLEINNLREKLQTVSIRIEPDQNIALGFGASYPVGGLIILDFYLPNLPIGFFLDFGINFLDIEKVNTYFGGGIKNKNVIKKPDINQAFCIFSLNHGFFIK
jgi:hypothetical protein